MEAQYVPAAVEPPKVRNRKPKSRNPSVQGPQAQQPRKSNRAPQPGAETWGHDEYGHADPAQSYGYGPGEHVDAHGYGYGSAHLDAAGQGYGYGYEGAQADVGQGYDYGYDHGYGGAQAGHNYDAQGYGHGYGDGYGGGQAGAGQEYAYVEHVQGNPKKSRKPRPVAVGSEVQGDYANPEAYNAVDPSQQNPPNRESKPRRTKSLEKRNQGNGEVPEPGSARSRTSQGSGSNRSQRQDGIARDQESAHSGKSGSARSGGKSMARPTEATGNNALNEHVRKAGGGKPPVVQDVSMAVFDPRDRTLIAPEARPSLDEWMKMQGNLPVQQDESLIVFDDHDKEELETRMFGGPLPKPNKQPPMKLPPLQEEQQRPQYHPRGGGAAPNPAIVPADDKPLYQPTQRQRQPSPLPQGGAIQDYNKPIYNNDDVNNIEIQAVQPNPKCMACVHGVGVPIARLGTRIACNACLCTIL